MGMSREQLLQLQAAARIYQARFDSALEPWGQRAPAPVFGQDPNDYRRNMSASAKKLLPTDHKLRRVKYWDLKQDAYEALEPDLLRAVTEHGHRNDSVPFDAPLRQVTETSQNGTVITKFLGQRSFVEDFKSVPRKVAYFRTPQGPIRTDGLPVNQ
jgi:hypothetical protein